jgi:hypothetical protein
MTVQIRTPVRAVPRAELEVSGQRVIEDAAGEEIAYVGFDEDAEDIAAAVNQHAKLLALRDAVGEFLRLGAIHQENYDALCAAFDKVEP